MNMQLLGLVQKVDSATREQLLNLLEKDPQAAVAQFVAIAASHGITVDPEEILSTLGLPPLSELKPEQIAPLVEGVRSKLKLLSLFGGLK